MGIGFCAGAGGDVNAEVGRGSTGKSSGCASQNLVYENGCTVRSKTGFPRCLIVSVRSLQFMCGSSLTKNGRPRMRSRDMSNTRRHTRRTTPDRKQTKMVSRVWPAKWQMANWENGPKRAGTWSVKTVWLTVLTRVNEKNAHSRNQQHKMLRRTERSGLLPSCN